MGDGDAGIHTTRIILGHASLVVIQHEMQLPAAIVMNNGGVAVDTQQLVFCHHAVTLHTRLHIQAEIQVAPIGTHPCALHRQGVDAHLLTLLLRNRQHQHLRHRDEARIWSRFIIAGTIEQGTIHGVGRSGPLAGGTATEHQRVALVGNGIIHPFRLATPCLHEVGAQEGIISVARFVVFGGACCGEQEHAPQSQ